MQRSAHFMVGDIECWALSDAAQPGRLHVDEWKLSAAPGELAAWLDAHGLSDGAIPLEWLCLLAHVRGEWMLADAGSGPKGDANTGMLRKHLVQVGVSPGEISTLFISHTHYDHIGGALLADGTPAFPHARVVLWDSERGQLELTAPVNKVLYEAAQDYLPRLGQQLVYAADGEEILPGARLAGLPGHTTGMAGLMLRSRGERVLFCGDLFYHALQVEHPEWCSQYDLYPVQAVDTRRRVYGWAADEGFLVLPSHAPLPGPGHIKRSGAGYLWLPLTAAQAQQDL